MWRHTSDIVNAGYLVAFSDYEGLGTPGRHPYLVGESEGRSVLDAAKAAAQLPGADAGDQLAIWGHSQGGHAALWAAQLAEAVGARAATRRHRRRRRPCRSDRVPAKQSRQAPGRDTSS